MIKFFRKIRYNLMEQNKTGKYIKYAIGEIILVIIGILIALSLNKKAEQKQAEAKVDTIFEDVLKELENDINQSTNLISYYRIKDSLASLVLNTELTYEDYANENSSELWSVATKKSPYNTSNKAYNLLMGNIDVIPDKYNEAVSILDRLHTIVKPQIDEYNDIVWELVKKNFDDFEENHAWYKLPDYKKSKEAIDYRLNNYKYKNKVRRYRVEAFSHRVHIGQYRFYSIKAYKQIAAILNKPIDSLSFIIDYKGLEKYSGDFVNKLITQSKINISLEEDRLKLKRKGIKDDVLLGLSSEQIFFIGNPKNAYYHFNENIETGIITLTEYKGHEAITYTKID
ncbi:hypothetical protein MWU50_04270 [Flavobacteriaceae bacterium S0862]|nr:hypothetical protein [Flavobacteriaceae bacterium S0862]